MTEEYLFYNGTQKIVYAIKEHVYYLVNQETGEMEVLDGVTGCVHIIDKSDALIPWAVKMMAQKLLATAPKKRWMDGSYTVRLDWPEFEKLVVAAKSAHKDKLEDAGKVGNVAHNWIEQYIKAQLSADEQAINAIDYLTCDGWPTDERAANGVRAAMTWMYNHNVRWRCTERKIYSRKYKYAGTMDGLCVVDSCDDPLCCKKPFKNRLSVADWKTSNYLYPEYLLQTAAYQQAYMEETKEKVQDRWVIRLGKDDGKFETWHCTKDQYKQDFAAFKQALDLTRSMRSIKARVKANADLLKESAKAKKQAEREIQLAFACKGSSTYKGVRPPQCNGGKPCITCQGKYDARQSEKGLPSTSCVEPSGFLPSPSLA